MQYHRSQCRSPGYIPKIKVVLVIHPRFCCTSKVSNLKVLEQITDLEQVSFLRICMTPLNQTFRKDTFAKIQYQLEFGC